MRNLVNPQQTRLFDPFDSVLTPQTRQRLMDSWPGVFRHVLLELMPASALAEHFDPVIWISPDFIRYSRHPLSLSHAASETFNSRDATHIRWKNPRDCEATRRS